MPAKPTLLLDVTRGPLFEQRNVNAPAGLKTPGVYNLALFWESGKSRRGVLTVDIAPRFSFFRSRKPYGSLLEWAGDQPDLFMKSFSRTIESWWSQAHPILPSRRNSWFDEINVVFAVVPWTTTPLVTETRWSVTVTKVDPVDYTKGFEGKVSKVSIDRAGADLEVTLYSRDLDPIVRDRIVRGVSTKFEQRPVLHEFGHIIGLRDEYPGGRARNPNWPEDLESVMFSGEKIRERHYAPFAHWLTRQFASLSLSGIGDGSVVWKVRGRTDLNNALL
ncbi:hypothetical protein [Reyranella sp. CPCC 100927]|uniref:hypothetical protein n=1 Tax=Reyranella sp. CPCC 100927 TaxID=2599616 RepID=UPI0011B54A37|nr:hypothetical protein [Reyranella sp. CPCC 100927]TWS99884.1 hypothetical protein FQU96_34360 [Reyranella sp. CPCC 100927]